MILPIIQQIYSSFPIQAKADASFSSIVRATSCKIVQKRQQKLHAKQKQSWQFEDEYSCGNAGEGQQKKLRWVNSQFGRIWKIKIIEWPPIVRSIFSWYQMATFLEGGEGFNLIHEDAEHFLKRQVGESRSVTFRVTRVLSVGRYSARGSCIHKCNSSICSTWPTSEKCSIYHLAENLKAILYKLITLKLFKT